MIPPPQGIWLQKAISGASGCYNPHIAAPLVHCNKNIAPHNNVMIQRPRQQSAGKLAQSTA
jgi:hypothetical protein